MTDNQIIKCLCNCVQNDECEICPYRNKGFCRDDLMLDVLLLTQRQKSEIERLTLTLAGVMHFVDKWLDGAELEQDEVRRASAMREKTLSIVESLQAQLKTARADAVREMQNRLLSEYTNGMVSIYEVVKIVQEMTEGER